MSAVVRTVAPAASPSAVAGASQAGRTNAPSLDVRPPGACVAASAPEAASVRVATGFRVSASRSRGSQPSRVTGVSRGSQPYAWQQPDVATGVRVAASPRGYRRPGAASPRGCGVTTAASPAWLPASECCQSPRAAGVRVASRVRWVEGRRAPRSALAGRGATAAS
ncbi:hypothetical protein GCM10023170_047000 [Phytohabitans houttuyneae]